VNGKTEILPHLEASMCQREGKSEKLHNQKSERIIVIGQLQAKKEDHDQQP